MRMFEALLTELGLPFAPHKTRGPTRVIEFLGFLLSNVDGHRCMALTSSRSFHASGLTGLPAACLGAAGGRYPMSSVFTRDAALRCPRGQVVDTQTPAVSVSTTRGLISKMQGFFLGKFLFHDSAAPTKRTTLATNGAQSTRAGSG